MGGQPGPVAGRRRSCVGASRSVPRNRSSLGPDTHVELGVWGALLQVILAAQIVQPVAVNPQQPRGVGLHLLSLFEGFLDPSPLESLDLLIEADAAGRQT